MACFINHYKCPQCGHTWCDEWSATCDNDCPNCGARHISPYKSDDGQPEPLDILRDLAETYRRINGTCETLSADDKLALLLAHEDAVFALFEGVDDE